VAVVTVTVRRWLGESVMLPYPSALYGPMAAKFVMASALICSSFCSARNTAVLCFLPTSTPLSAYWNPPAMAVSPTVTMTAATSTSGRLSPRSSRIMVRIQPFPFLARRALMGW
jgi:hypothetical protein